MTISKKIGTSWTSSSSGASLIKLLGTCFGLGYLPKAPGTFGSLFGIGLFLLTKDYSVLMQVVLFFVFMLLALGTAEKLEKIMRCKDPEAVVVDEAAGMWISLFFIWDASWLVITVGFIIFRLLDILKPFPINLFQSFRGGMGVVADDISAGMLTNFILRLLNARSVL